MSKFTMPNPFPGMNPYLENPPFWAGVHDGLIFTLNEALMPVFGVPLLDGVPDVPVDLQALLNRVYEAGAHDELIAYQMAPDLPLRKIDAEWADDLLKRKGLRL